jgi:predicted dehydrogenase
MDVLRVGVIGLGRVSEFYLDALRASPRCELAAVCDTDSEAMARFVAAGMAAYDDPDALLADPRIDAVVVDTPVTTHADITAAALSAGKHACCEKPLALSRQRAAELHALAASEGRALLTSFHRRYNRNLPAPGSVRSAAIAEVEVLYQERIEEHVGAGTWHLAEAQAGGGVIVDNGPNAFAIVCHLFDGLVPTSVDVERSGNDVDVSAVLYGVLGDATDVRMVLDWAFEGERKELVLHRHDGVEERYDMLAGFPAFKSSLRHEYAGLFDHFADLAEAGEADTLGYECTAWLEDVLTLTRGR